MGYGCKYYIIIDSVLQLMVKDGSIIHWLVSHTLFHSWTTSLGHVLDLAPTIRRLLFVLWFMFCFRLSVVGSVGVDVDHLCFSVI